MQVTTVGIDLAKNVFVFMVAMHRAGRCCASNSCGGSS
jgi:hypothetical protein